MQANTRKLELYQESRNSKGAHVPPFPEIPHHTDRVCHPHRSRQASERYDRSDRSPLETSPNANGHPNTDYSLLGRQILVKSSLPQSAESFPPLMYKSPPRRRSLLSSVPPHPLPSTLPSCALRRCTSSSPGYGAPSTGGSYEGDDV